MKRKCFLVMLILGVFALVACATTMTTGQAMKTWAQKSPTEKATMILSTWNYQFRDAMDLATNPKSTAVQKELAAKKKEILTQTKPMVDLYVTTVKNGGVPDPKTEDEIRRLLNSIGGQL